MAIDIEIYLLIINIKMRQIPFFVRSSFDRNLIGNVKYLI